MENLIESNKLIAEFMGLRFHKIGWVDSQHIDGNYECEELLYHSDWNWFMDAYKKAKDFLQNLERPSQNHCCKGDGIDVDVHCAVMIFDIQRAFKHLVELIEWINTTKQLSHDK